MRDKISSIFHREENQRVAYLNRGKRWLKTASDGLLRFAREWGIIGQMVAGAAQT